MKGLFGGSQKSQADRGSILKWLWLYTQRVLSVLLAILAVKGRASPLSSAGSPFLLQSTMLKLRQHLRPGQAPTCPWGILKSSMTAKSSSATPSKARPLLPLGCCEWPQKARKSTISTPIADLYAQYIMHLQSMSFKGEWSPPVIAQQVPSLPWDESIEGND